jgi:hypothetical protein
VKDKHPRALPRTIKVRLKHIREGRWADFYRCPLALALREELVKRLGYEPHVRLSGYWTLIAREEWKFARKPTFDENGIHRLVDPKTGQPRIWDRMDERVTTSCQRALNEKCSLALRSIGSRSLITSAFRPWTSHFWTSVRSPRSGTASGDARRIHLLR